MVTRGRHSLPPLPPQSILTLLLSGKETAALSSDRPRVTVWGRVPDPQPLSPTPGRFPTAQTGSSLDKRRVFEGEHHHPTPLEA